jgi:ketosteroid isomerase-like protein
LDDQVLQRGDQVLDEKQGDQVSLTDEVRGLNDGFSKAVSNRDVDGLVKFYAPDAKVLAPGVPMFEGGAAIKGFLQMMLDEGVRALEFESIVVDGQGDLVVDVGRYRLTMEPPGGEPVIDVGKYIAVSKRQGDGSLRLAYDTFNSDAPPS